VIGDSTAAGLGNRPLPEPSQADRACQRSADSYAADLANANGWQVTNLACSGATIARGLLGSQRVGSTTLPPQLKTAEVANASTVVVSIGANDVNWSAVLEACAASQVCGNHAEQAFFQQQLARFAPEYFQLITQLQLLPNHPRVVINLYYNPFTGDDACLASVDITDAKRRSLISRLDALNAVLAQGAQTAGFASATPTFNGHGVCDPQPYVQGVAAAAPFHPTSSGELAIALADERALRAIADG
jgi:lysophospholipase L1-like esterase